MTTAVWSPTDHSSVVTISGANAIATRNSIAGGGSQAARSDTAQSSGVRYVEFNIVEIGNGAGVPMEVGCCNGVVGLGTYPGSSNNGVSYRPNGTVIKNAANVLTSQPTYTTGDVIGMVVDLDAHTVKFNKNGGSFTSTVSITTLGTDVFAGVSLGDGGTFSSVQLQESSLPAGTLGWLDVAPGNATINVIGHGDSISLTGAVQRTYLPRLVSLMTAAGEVPRWTRAGINGASWTYAWPTAGYPSTLTEDIALRTTSARVSSPPNRLIAFAGTNGITLAAHSAATEYANFQTYLAAQLAAGFAVSEIYVLTMLPRTGVSEVTRSAYNALLIAGAITSGYNIVRLDLEPNIGAAGQNLNTTWFLDGTHPTDAGHAVIAQKIYDAMYLARSTVGGVKRGSVEDDQLIRRVHQSYEEIEAIQRRKSDEDD